MKLATWNVNSLRIRLDHVLRWLETNQPDLLCLQETKCPDEAFPLEGLEAAGWQACFHGQKSYNGVALVSKKPVEVVATHLPHMKKDDSARYLEVLADGWRVICLYAPNGNPATSDKFTYKLDWLEALYAHIASLLPLEEKLIIAGDYNIIPTAQDVWDATGWQEDALYLPQSRAAWRKLLWLGLTDAIAIAHDGAENYSFWDYQKGAWQKNHGIRIDHVLLSPQAADCLTAAGIDKTERAQEKPSDHVPVWVELNE